MSRGLGDVYKRQILDMKFKDVVKACMGGVLLAGIIMGLASAGVLGAASSLFAV